MKAQTKRVFDQLDLRMLQAFVGKLVDLPSAASREEILELIDRELEADFESACNPMLSIHLQETTDQLDEITSRVVDLGKTVDNLDTDATKFQDKANSQDERTRKEFTELETELHGSVKDLSTQVNQVRTEFQDKASSQDERARKELAELGTELHGSVRDLSSQVDQVRQDQVKKMSFAWAATFFSLITGAGIFLSIFGGINLFSATSRFQELYDGATTKISDLTDDLDETAIEQKKRIKELEQHLRAHEKTTEAYHNYFVGLVINDFRRLFANFDLGMLDDAEFQKIGEQQAILKRYRISLGENGGVTGNVLDLLLAIGSAFQACEQIISSANVKQLEEVRSKWKKVMKNASNIGKTLKAAGANEQQLNFVSVQVLSFAENVLGVVELVAFRRKWVPHDEKFLSSAEEHFKRSINLDKSFGRPKSNFAVVHKFRFLQKMRLAFDKATGESSSPVTIDQLSLDALLALEGNLRSMMKNANDLLKLAAEFSRTKRGVATAYNNRADLALLHARLCLAIALSPKLAETDKPKYLQIANERLDEADVFLTTARRSDNRSVMSFTESEVIAARAKLLIGQGKKEKTVFAKMRRDVIGLIEASRLAGEKWGEKELQSYVLYESEFRYITNGLGIEFDDFYEQIMSAARPAKAK